MQALDTIRFNSISSIPKMIRDFLNGKDFGGQALYRDDLLLPKINAKKETYSKENRQILMDVITKQSQNERLSEKQKANLKALADSNTFTVTTGHQLNLFTGPVFFIYKILQTIKCAKFFADKASDYHFVPLFWMATEDHDFEEINHFASHNQYFETQAKTGNAVGRIPVEDVFFISEFEAAFKDEIYGTELILLLKKAYQKGKTFAEAMRVLVQYLFSSYGLLMIDGDDPELKSIMKPIFKMELLESPLLQSTQQSNEKIKNDYGKLQVNPREINLFYLDNSRNRITFTGELFQIVDTDITFTKDELLDELENHPEKFSPNAVLRPIFQETILPNIAYIGGNAEVMYWLQLPDFFKKLSLPFPFLIPRNSILLLTDKTVKKVEKLGLRISDFLSDFPTLSKNILLDNHPVSHVLDSREQLLITQFEKLEEVSSKTDISFRNMIQAEKARQLKSFKRLRKRLLRAEKIKQHEKLERLQHLFLEVHPSGIWQERVNNFSEYYAEHGESWITNCYQQLSPVNSQLIILKI